MIIKSINKADVKIIKYRGKEVKTGIFKKEIKGEAKVTELGLQDDNVVDRRYHGDYDKGLYAYGVEQYNFWKEEYPELEFEWGMFGENLTVEGLNEAEINIGDQWEIGEEVVLEVSQPRQPCFKLGARFGTQKVVKAFCQAPYPGVYFRIIKPGTIQSGDRVEVVPSSSNLSIGKVWDLMFGEKNSSEIHKAITHPKLAKATKETLEKRL